MTVLPFPVLEDDEEVFQHDVLRLLAEGRVVETHAALRRRPERDLFVELAEADARLRTFDLHLIEAVRLRDRVDAREPAGSPLRYWAQVLVCERLVMDMDGAGVMLAQEAMGSLPADPLPPLLTLYCRARLARLAACVWLTSPLDEARATGQVWRDAAVLDLLRCGFSEEAAWTRGMSAGLQAMVWGDDLVRDLVVMRSARRLLHDGSMWPLLLDCFLAIVAFQVGDLHEAHAAADRLDKAATDFPLMNFVAGMVRQFAAVVSSGGSDEAVAELEQSLDFMAALNARMMHSFQTVATNMLLDLGSPHARRLGLAALDPPAIDPAHAVDLKVLRWRLITAEGSPPRIPELVELLERMKHVGRSREAALAALRIARDLVRNSNLREAEELHRWGLAHLPDRSDWVLWEHFLAQPLDPDGDGAEAIASAATPAVAVSAQSALLVVRVMRPSLEVLVRGEPVSLSGNAARLVLTLALAHPNPVHAEQAADALWPDGPVDTGRSRLNTVVHRVRRALGLPEGVLVRTGDLIAFDPEQVHIDAAVFEATAGAPLAAQLRALADVRGNLCEAQFPYDEALVDARHRFAARWLDRARVVVRANESAVTRLSRAAEALSLEHSDLVMR